MKITKSIIAIDLDVPVDVDKMESIAEKEGA